MHRLILFAYLLFAAGITNGQDADRGLKKLTPKDSAGTSYAVVIGVSAYPNLKPLLYADDDANLFADYLVDEKICATKDVHTFIDTNATRTNIYTELKKLLAKVRPADQLFIYFAGHGDVESEINSAYLLTYDCEPNNYSATAMDIGKLQQFVHAFTEKGVRVILITDACRSGNLAGGMSGAANTMSVIYNGFEKTVKILSCEPNQLSKEKEYPDGGHGIFTYHLVDGLRGMADTDSDSLITLRELRLYLDRVRTESGKTQIPTLVGTAENPVARYDESLRLALVEKRKGTSLAVHENSKGQRGVEDSTWQENHYYKTFTDHMRRQRFIKPAAKNAYSTILAAESAKQPAAMISDMKFDLAAVLEDETQKWITKYLRGELEEESVSLAPYLEIEKLVRYLSAAETLLGKNDLNYSEIHAKRLFFTGVSYSYHTGYSNGPRKALAIMLDANRLFPDQAWMLHYIAKMYFKINELTQAESFARRAVELAPRWAVALKTLGEILSQSKNFETAENYFKANISKDPERAEHWAELGKFYLTAKQIPLAEASFKKATAVNPEFADAWISLGELYINQEKAKKAELVLLQGLSHISYNANLHGNLALLYYSLDQETKAESYFLKAIALNPRADWWRILLLLFYEDMGETEKLNSLFEAWFRDYPEKLVAAISLQTHFKSVKLYDNAVVQIKKLVDDDPGDKLYWMALADAYGFQHDTVNSISALKKMISLDPTDPQLTNYLASYYTDIGDTVKATAALRQAIQLDSTYLDSWYDLGFLYRSSHRYDEAEAVYYKIAAIDTTDNLPWTALGRLFDLLNKSLPAEKAFIKALRLDPRDQELHKELANFYSRKHEPEKAEETLKAATVINGRDEAAWNDLAEYYADQKKYFKAASTYLEALARDSFNLTLYEKLAEVYKKAGNHFLVEKTFQKMTRVDSSDGRSWDALSEFYEKEKKYGPAKAAAARACEKEPYNNEYLFHSASLSEKLENYAEAETGYKTAVRRDSLSSETWTELGAYYVRQKNYAAAERSYKMAVQVDEVSYENWENLANFYDKQHNAEEAVTVLTRGIRTNPSDMRIRYQLAELFRDHKEVVKAEKTLKDAWLQDSSNSIPLIKLAEFYKGERRYRDAAQAYKNAVAKDSLLKDTWEDMGKLYELMNDFPEAEKAYLRMTKIDSTRGTGWERLADLYLKYKKYPAVENAYINYLKGNSYYRSDLEKFGAGYEEEEAYDGAEGFYKRIYSLYPDVSWDILQALYVKTGRYRLAAAASLKEIRYDSLQPTHRNALSEILLGEDKDREAKVQSLASVQLDSSNSKSYDQLGKAYLALYELDAAENAFKKAAEKDPSNIDPLIHLSDLYTRRSTDQSEEAATATRKAIELQPDNDLLWKKALANYNKTSMLAWLRKNPRISAPTSDLLTQIALVYQGKEDYDAAEGYYLEAVHASPLTAIHYFNLAVFYVDWKKYENALQYTELALEYGYDVFPEISDDRRFDAVKKLPGYFRLVKLYKK